MKSCLIALLVLASATIVSAAEEQPEPAKPVKEKKICHTDKLTGSRTKVRRICMTKAQWDQLYESTRQGMDSFSRGSNQTAPAISDGAGGSPQPNVSLPQ